MTIDDPSTPPRTRREARAQTGSHRGVEPSGMNAFFQGAGGAPHGAGRESATRNDTELPGGGDPVLPGQGQEGHEEPPSSTDMLRTLFGEPDQDGEPEETGPVGDDAFSRAMFGMPTTSDPSSPAQPVQPTSAADARTATGLDARFGAATPVSATPVAATPVSTTPVPAPPVAAMPGSAPADPVSYAAEQFDPADDATRVAPVVTGIPGWNDEATQAAVGGAGDAYPALQTADDDAARLSASLAYFAAADAASAASTVGLADAGLAGSADVAAAASAGTVDATADLGAASAAAGAALVGAAAVSSAETPASTAPLDLAGLGLDPDDDPDLDEEPATLTPAAWADESHTASALTWIDTAAVQARTRPPTLAVRTAADDEPDLLSDLHTKSGWLRPRVLIPLGLVGALVGGYCATTLLAPLDNIAPTIDPVAVKIDPAPAAAITWPKGGNSGIDVQGFATAASSGEKTPIASISKIASVMMVLEKMPLKPGEQGPSFDFTRSDGREYWQYLRSNQSALDVPVGGSLTEYQMLQGILLGSANNYIDRLADEIWGSKDAFASAAHQWLSDQGLDDTTIISPSGRDDRNRSTPADLIDLSQIAMRNPVFAEIVATKSVNLPGAGEVKNTNKMLAEDAGVVGIKTGTLGDDWNLVTAKDVKIGDSTVRLFAVTLGQGSNNKRVAANRALYAQVEKTLADQPVTVPKGTVVGTVDTVWGERSDVITDSDAKVVMWNGSPAGAKAALKLGDAQKAGTKVGSLTVTGAVDTAKTNVSLKSSVEDPSAWWRLTHPLDLFGLND
ncbi:D-alanyl-D-alanine carboxypeptidase [Microbacterium sp. NPDC057650]|uniref:D-alanyl-D-alanine carboxypeptidase n=1 Tax=unclassified Microbacterium TaxID=2609290 RepID=UPI00366FD8F8